MIIQCILVLPLFLAVASGSLVENVCCGRCAVANRKYGFDKEDCISQCCFHNSTIKYNNSLQFPVGCPLRNYTHCSVPTPLRAPDLSIENKTGLLLFSATPLEKGISLCTSISNESFSLREAHVAVVKSVHFPSLKVFHQLLYTGKEDELDLNTTECYNVTAAVINECGVSNFSNTTFFPSNESFSIHMTVNITELQDMRPNITVLWEINGTLPASSQSKVSMDADYIPKLKECITTFKEVKASKGAASFLPEDFQNNSVWLCIFSVKVSVSYFLPCMLGKEMRRTEQRAIITSQDINGIRLNISSELIWDAFNRAYTIKLIWNVPQVHALDKKINFFSIDIPGYSWPCHIPVPQNDQEPHTIVVKGVDIRSPENYHLSIKTNINTLILQEVSIPIKGKPPTAVSNITVHDNGSHFVVNWDEPVKTNGPISSYSISITVYGVADVIVNKELNINTVSTHHAFLARDYLGEHATKISFNVTATNMFGTSPSDGITYECSQTVNIPNDTNIIVAGVVAAVFLVGTILVIVIIIVIAKRHVRTAAQQGFREFPKTFNGVPKDIMEINEDSYELYFKRLPPAMVDRWVIPLHMFNTDSFHLLGEGNFSSVYFSVVRGPLSTPTQLDQFRNYSEESIAVKLLKSGASEQEMEAFINEAEILKTLSTQNCPYVVQLVGLQLEHAPPMIAMELVPCGNLLNILKSTYLTGEDEEAKSLIALVSPKHPQNLVKQQTLVQFQRDRCKSIDSYIHLRNYSLEREPQHVPNDTKIAVKGSQLLQFVIQAIRGIEHLQGFGILHRDLACRNLLLSANGIIKISDFGFACFLDGKSEVVAELPTDSKPLRWMSPEAFENDVYSEASDVWSFGVTLWEIFSQGKFPYPTLSDADVLEAVKAGSYLECPENCDKKVYNLMLDCWMLNPNDRPTFSALKTTVESFMYDLYPYLQPEL